MQVVEKINNAAYEFMQKRLHNPKIVAISLEDYKKLENDFEKENFFQTKHSVEDFFLYIHLGPGKVKIIPHESIENPTVLDCSLCTRVEFNDENRCKSCGTLWEA